jgi:ankyrin repeat protein
VLEVLVQSGAPINSKEPKGMSLLHTMVAHQRPSAIETFLKLGTDWFQDWRGHNALWYAIKCPFQGANVEESYEQTIEALVKGHPRGQKGGVKFREHGTRSTALHAAAKYGNYKVAKRLIVWGAEVDARDGKGHTPLWLAAAHGQVDVAILLINAGADVDIQGIEGSTALRVASRNGGVGKDTIPNFVQV